ncbi:MAG: hypothetical protein ACI92Z_002384 [Paracoccaceae bacterium]|jgi:hypothetical protein
MRLDPLRRLSNMTGVEPVGSGGQTPHKVLRF